MALDIPHSCTLPTTERPVRLAEFDTLLGSATSAQRDYATHLTFYFDDAEGLEAQARDLTADEIAYLDKSWRNYVELKDIYKT